MYCGTTSQYFPILPACMDKTNHHALVNAIDRVYDNNNSKQKLNAEQVFEIKIALQNPYYGIQKDLANKYKVHRATINDIKTKKRWSHIKIE